MNYAYTCDGATLSQRLRTIDALRSADERMLGPDWQSERGASTSGALVSVGLMLTLAGIALFCAVMLTQDFTGKYKGYAKSATAAESSAGLSPKVIPNIGQ